MQQPAAIVPPVHSLATYWSIEAGSMQTWMFVRIWLWAQTVSDGQLSSLMWQAMR